MARKRVQVDDPDAQEMPTLDGGAGNISVETYDAVTQGYGGTTHVSKASTEEPISKQQANNRWVHRRRMAYIALVSMIAAIPLLFFLVPAERLDNLQDPIGWFFISMASIVGAYVGFATYSDVMRAR